MCILLSLLGLFLIVRGDLSIGASSDLIGIGFSFAAAVFYAGVMISGRFIRGFDQLELTIIQIGLAHVALVVYVYITNGGHFFIISSGTWGYLAYQGVFNTCVAFWLFFSGMQKLTSQSVAPMSYVDPLVAILVSAVVLREGFSLGTVNRKHLDSRIHLYLRT